MNALLIILLVLVLWRVIFGFRNGFTEECYNLVAIFIALLVIALLVLLAAGIMASNGIIIAVAAVLIVLVILAYRLVALVMKSVKALAELPGFRFADKILGIIAGFLEVLALFWIVYLLIDILPASELGNWMLMQTENNLVLETIYKHNYIAKLVTNLWQ